MIRFRCPHCDKNITVGENAAGKRGKCPGCGNEVRVPEQSEQVPVAASPFPVFPEPAPPSRIVEPPSFPPVFVASAPTHVSAVQVNVSTSHAAHSLGIASLIIGILSFFVCWMPFIGLFLGGLGAILGLGGLILALARKGAGVGYSIAGTAVSSIALVVGIGYMLFAAGTFAAVDGAVAAARQAEKQNNQQRAPRSQRPNRAEPRPTIPAAPVDGPDTEEAPGPTWTQMGIPARVGDVRVDLLSASVGKVPLTERFTDRQTESEDDLLLIKLRVSNESQRKKIDFRSWMSDFPSLLDGPAAKLTDESENRYRQIRFGATSRVVGTESSASIYPGKSIEDAVVFEPPVEGAETLRLVLSAKLFGAEGAIRFESPASELQRRPGAASDMSRATEPPTADETDQSSASNEKPRGIVAQITLEGDAKQVPKFLKEVSEAYASAKSRIAPGGDGLQVEIWGSRVRMSEGRLRSIAAANDLQITDITRTKAE